MVDVANANSEFAYSNVSSITTDFNVSPYYDDYNKTKNYYKILFKPGYAIQAREATQMQSILQEQINRFGQHVFKEGSMVLGGKFDIDTRAHFVKVGDKDLLGETVDITRFEGQIVTGQTTGIKALVNIVADGVEGTELPKTLYVSYLTGNPDTNEVVFTPNEPLLSNVGTLVVGNTVPVGYGSVFTINEGIRFAKEHFIYHTKQSVVVDRYDIRPTCKVGFFLEESIVTASDDSSLLDPALESSNYSAPGADRFMITPILTRLEIDDTAGYPDYVNLFVIENGKVTEMDERPTYNVIRDEIAKRTSDESGDYYVRGFNTVIEEHLDNGRNAGYLTADRGGDSSLLSVQIEAGTAYVKGYEVNKLVTTFLTTEKSTAYSNVNGQIISSPVGSYILANEVVGAWNVNSGTQIDLYDTANQRITRGGGGSAVFTGNKIGTARVKSISKDSGLLGTPSGILRIHLFDITMAGTNSFSSVRSVYYDNSTTADLGGDVVLFANSAKVQDVYSGLLYYTGSNYTKTIRSPDGTIDTSFFFKKSQDVSIASDGTFAVTSSIGNEIFPYGTTTLSSSDKEDIFLTLNAPVSISLSGTTQTGGGTTILRSAGTAFTRLNVGDKIEFSGNTKTYVIASIQSATQLTVTQNLPPSITGNTITKVYKAGDMIDMNSIGATAGTARSVSATPTALTFNLQEPFGSSISATITYTMAKTSAKEIRKVLKKNRYVLIDCASAGTTGPFNLGFSDVFRVNSIRKASSFATVDDGADVTRDFVIDNGQRDNCYKNGRIIPYSVLSASDKLLVCLDYFQPDYTLGVGYFSVDSYPVNDVAPTSEQITTAEIPIFRSPDTGLGYDLRNFFDFRPVFTNTSADATSLSGISTNPTVSTSLQYESGGLRLPAESESITFDYSYYLARKDIITLNKNGDFMIIKGVPAQVPITPSCPPHLMSVARMVIAPYPSLSPSYATSVGRGDAACSTSRTAQVRFTMKDIGVLKQRVDNLENYVALSLLEKSALDMKILDENGLDRFKNGIFVDSFTSFALSDYGNQDHRICYDPKEGSIRPLHESDAIGYNVYSQTNVVEKNGLLMLPYTEVVAIKQPYATTIRNVETTVYRFVGKLYLDPDSDYWVNTTRLASQTFYFGATDADVTPYSVVYGSWQTTVTGVTTTDPKLISTTSTSSTVTGTVGTTGTKTYELSFAGNYNYSYSTVKSLVDTYGASTPVTLVGNSAGGGQTFQSGSLSAYYSNIKTLGDVLNNASQLGAINVFYLTISTLTGSTATTTTKTSNTFQTTTTTGTQASRTFTETFQTLKTETQSIGDKVTTVAPIADIRPQTIGFEARGLKAGTRHYVFFDGQLMSTYVTPGIIANSRIYASNTISKNITATGKEGAALYSLDNGRAYGFLRIPSDSTKSFRTGTKEVIITDSPTNEPDSTSAAKAFFAAQGITQTVQDTIITTGYIVTEQKSGVQTNPIVYSNTTNTYTKTSTTVLTSNTAPTATVKIVDRVSCMAYSFKLNTPNGEEGMFLSSVDVFFAAKDPDLGVWFEIRAMDNGGTITKVQVPDSEVWLTPEEVKLSDDGSVATNVAFKAPIFLQNNQEYAFIIHTVGINPNYYMFVSVLGQTDILSKQQVNERPLTGTLFTTNNNTDWDMVPRVDLKITFNRAKFRTDVVGQAILGNESMEYIRIPYTDASWANLSWFGDRVLGSDELLLPSTTGVKVGDIIYSNTCNARIVYINGNRCRCDNTGFIIYQNVTIINVNTMIIVAQTNVASVNTGSGLIYKIMNKNDNHSMDTNSRVLVLKQTNGQFSAPNNKLHMYISGNTVITK